MLQNCSKIYEMKRNGFTLLEIILIIILLSLLSITFLIKWSGFEEIKLSSAISKLASDIAYAQHLAITTQLYHGISFDLANERYYLFRIEDGSLSTIEDPYNPKKDFVVEYNTEELQGVTLESISIKDTQLIFNWKGTPCNITGEELDDDVTITLACKGKTKTLTITAQTGKIVW